MDTRKVTREDYENKILREKLSIIISDRIATGNEKSDRILDLFLPTIKYKEMQFNLALNRNDILKEELQERDAEIERLNKRLNLELEQYGLTAMKLHKQEEENDRLRGLIRKFKSVFTEFRAYCKNEKERRILDNVLQEIEFVLETKT